MAYLRKILHVFVVLAAAFNGCVGITQASAAYQFDHHAPESHSGLNDHDGHTHDEPAGRTSEQQAYIQFILKHFAEGHSENHRHFGVEIHQNIALLPDLAPPSLRPFIRLSGLYGLCNWTDCLYYLERPPRV